ncbi:MAG: sulfotransferase family 2 domain-containing protein [Cyanobacteria bacterium P01_D01_bin.156]
MIISHKHKFIFIKTTKTAGTSVEIALSRFCGEDDVVTPLMQKDEVMRKEYGGHGPQNFERACKLTEYSKGDWWRLLSQGKRSKVSLFWNHITANQIKSRISPDQWDSYYKFCFVRNPWDRAVSRYFWNIERDGIHENLDESLKNNNPNSNFGIYSINGQVVVDFVGKYENLMADFMTICQTLKIPFDGELPRAKSTSRKTKKHYSEILSSAQAEYIRQKCSQEVELFGYQYAKASHV